MNQDQLFKLANNNTRQNEKIVVFGVGGGGGNALNHIIESNVQGVDFVAANTDARALDMNLAPNKIILGETLTRGLGAGADPSVGNAAAKESIDRIKEYITDADMLFVTAGMGGGTGTGAAPVIAQTAKDMNVLVVGVVTLPFLFEMGRRMKTAQAGIEELKKNVDALLVVENERLLQIAGDKMRIVDAYKKVDEVLRQAVQGVTDLITKSGFVNLDFADIRAVLTKAGTAIMGMGEGEGDNRAETAARNALTSPLMNAPVDGANGILMNVTSGTEITLKEMTDAAKIIEETADQDAQVIWGHVIDEELGDKVHVTLIATFPENAKVNQTRKPNVKLRDNNNSQNQNNNQNNTRDNRDVRDNRENNTPAHNEKPQQPQQYPPRSGGRNIYDIYQRRHTPENFEITKLSTPNDNEREPFRGLPRRAYDQPAIFRTSNNKIK